MIQVEYRKFKLRLFLNDYISCFLEKIPARLPLALRSRTKAGPSGARLAKQDREQARLALALRSRTEAGPSGARLAKQDRGRPVWRSPFEAGQRQARLALALRSRTEAGLKRVGMTFPFEPII